MTYSAQKGDVQISGANSLALRREIADRLGASLDRKPAQLPPHLTMLMDRFRDEPGADQPRDIEPDLNS
jgi:hypothetical protein